MAVNLEMPDEKFNNTFKSFKNVAEFNGTYPHSIVILWEYFGNVPWKSCNISRIFIKLLERFLKYCRNLAMSVQNIINGMWMQY